MNQTAFGDSNHLPPPKLPEIPFKADLETILDLDYENLVERGYHGKSINKWLYSYGAGFRKPIGGYAILPFLAVIHARKTDA